MSQSADFLDLFNSVTQFKLSHFLSEYTIKTIFWTYAHFRSKCYDQVHCYCWGTLKLFRKNTKSCKKKKKMTWVFTYFLNRVDLTRKSHWCFHLGDIFHIPVHFSSHSPVSPFLCSPGIMSSFCYMFSTNNEDMHCFIVVSKITYTKWDFLIIRRELFTLLWLILNSFMTPSLFLPS